MKRTNLERALHRIYAPMTERLLRDWERRQRRERTITALVWLVGIAAGAVVVLVALGVL